MSTPAIKRTILGALALGGLLLLAACDPVERMQPAPGAEAGDAVALPRDGKLALKGLDVGLGSVERDEKGLAAGLWLAFPGDVSKNRVVRAHVGERVEAAGYTVLVEELRGGRRASAVFRVSGPKAR